MPNIYYSSLANNGLGIAGGIVMRREQKPRETVFGPVRWVAIPNDG
jgi:hypothetical protein